MILTGGRASAMADKENPKQKRTTIAFPGQASGQIRTKARASCSFPLPATHYAHEKVNEPGRNSTSLAFGWPCLPDRPTLLCLIDIRLYRYLIQQVGSHIAPRAEVIRLSIRLTMAHAHGPDTSEGVQHELFLAEGNAFMRFYSLENFSRKTKDQAYLSLQFLVRFHEYKCRALTSPYLLDVLWSRIESALTKSNSLRVLAPDFSLDKENIVTVVLLNTATLADTLAHGGWNNGEEWISETSVYFAMVDLIRSNLTNQPPRSLRVRFCNPEFFLEDERILSALGAEVISAKHLEESYAVEQRWKADTLFYDEQTQKMWLGKCTGNDGYHPHSGQPSGSGSAPPPPPVPAPVPAGVPPGGFLLGGYRIVPQMNPDFGIFRNLPNIGNGQPSEPPHPPQQPDKPKTGGGIFGINNGAFPQRPITTEQRPAITFGQPSGVSVARNPTPSPVTTKPANPVPQASMPGFKAGTQPAQPQQPLKSILKNPTMPAQQERQTANPAQSKAGNARYVQARHAGFVEDGADEVL